MPDKSIYERIYDKLIKLIPDLLTVKKAQKAKSLGYMDLNLDILEDTSEYRVIALSHYYKHPSGDMIPDPDMTVKVYKKSPVAEALSYQDIYRYQQVYVDDKQFYPKLKAELNRFLNFWLSNLLKQGFSFKPKEEIEQTALPLSPVNFPCD